MTTQQTGFYGKLPAHGDFIHRNLSVKFINVWDDWLQTFVGSSQERMGEGWLPIYLTSPIWRFCLSPGVVDEFGWAGVMLPSVDRVGRYFPFTVVTRIDSAIPLTDLLTTGTPWFESAENLALQALDGQICADDILEQLQQQKLNICAGYVRNVGGESPARGGGLIVEKEFLEQSADGAMPLLLDGLLKQSFPSYSIWTTDGSEQVEPCVFVSPGLPSVSNGPALLDGHWVEWGWSMPFVRRQDG